MRSHLVIILLFLVLAGSGCIGASDDPLSICNKIQGTIIQDTCYEEIGKLREDPSSCERIQDKWKYDNRKDLCYLSVINDIPLNKKDLSTCNNIQNKMNRYKCYAIIGAAKEDSSVCEKIKITYTGPISTCYKGVAVGKKDISVCEKIHYKHQHLEEKDDCYAAVAEAKKDPSICEKIKYDFIKKECYYLVAVAKQNNSICNLISENETDDYNADIRYTKSHCNESVDLEKKLNAIAKGDISLCGEIQYINKYITYGNYQDQCYSGVAVVKKDISICEKILGDTNEREYCYSDIAVAKKDLSICDKIADDDVNDSCYRRVAEARKDVSICEKIQDQDDREWCYKLVAIAKEDISICDDLFVDASKNSDSCYYGVAVAKRDSSICEKIQNIDRKFNENLRYFCYEEVAGMKADLSICNKIQDDETKDYCYQSVAIAKANSTVHSNPA